MSRDASSSSIQLPDDIAALKAIIAKKDATISQQQATISQLVETNTEYQQTIQQQGQRIAQLLRKQYGPRREFINPDQLTLFTPDELEALAKEMTAHLA